MYSVSFTGHRPEKLPYFSEDDPMCIDLKQRLKTQIEMLINEGADSFFSGMARGVDLWCAEIIIELKCKFPELKLTAVIPCKTQTNNWDDQSIIRYNNILEHCDKKIYISDNYNKSCMLKRDRAIVELCDVLIAVFDGAKGGTEYTVKYAEKKRKKVIIIPPM
ncbi:MAG: DUF1273 family protein [Oscillospiraceae bacterium]|nr:DUF1273 family protein [Oscillospiraceae bacterium]